MVLEVPTYGITQGTSVTVPNMKSSIVIYESRYPSNPLNRSHPPLISVLAYLVSFMVRATSESMSAELYHLSTWRLNEDLNYLIRAKTA